MSIHLRNTPEGYGWISIVLHWVSFLLVLLLLGGGVFMVTLSYYDPLYHTLPHWHKVAGVVVIALTALRLGWLWRNPRPHLLAAPRWQQWSARAMHWTLYGLLLALGVTGYVMTTAQGKPIELVAGVRIPALRTWPTSTAELHGLLHRWGAYGLGALVLLHSGAALLHHFGHRDATLRRMLKPPRN